MGSKGGSRHLKKLSAPKAWNIQRKDYIWITKPRAGPHSLENSLALTTIIRVVLGKAETSREAEKLITNGEIHVDGRPVKDPKFAVGFMDILSIPTVNENYIVLFDRNGRLRLEKIEGAQKFKLCRIESKNMFGRRKQIGLHDGRTMLVDKEYRIGDVLKISVPDQKILDHFEFKKGNVAYVIKGQHAGKVGKIKDVVPGTASREPMVIMEKEGESFNVPKKYVFVVGKDKAEIKIK